MLSRTAQRALQQLKAACLRSSAFELPALQRACASTSAAPERLQQDPQQMAALFADLVCPLSKAPLRYDPHTSQLVCDDINVAYPVVDGIPCLLPTQGRLLEQEELRPQ